jgi:hypothetical protein
MPVVGLQIPVLGQISAQVPQLMVWPQLFTPDPHSWPLVQMFVGVQHDPLVQTCVPVHPQLTCCPQLFVLTLPQLVPHVVASDSGVQQEVPSHTCPL